MKILVESVNTGRVWEFDTEDELRKFMHGRNQQFYKVTITHFIGFHDPIFVDHFVRKN